MPMTLKDLMTSGCQSSPDGIHWEPALPYPGPMIRNVRDAWEVLTGRAVAVTQTPSEPRVSTRQPSGGTK